MSNTSPTPSAVSLAQACDLLDVSRQAVTKRYEQARLPGRGQFQRAPIVEAHLSRVAELEAALARLRLAGREAGIASPVNAAASMPGSGDRDDNELTLAVVARFDDLEDRLARLEDALRARIDQVSAELEIDRLKAEVRRANATIDALQALVSPARPQEDTGLDSIPR